jgi:hypothetical protein
VFPFQLGHVLEIHAIPRADHHQRRGDERDHGEEFHDLAGLVRRDVEVDLEDAREGIHVALRKLRDVIQAVVHVAVIRHQVRADELEFTARKMPEHLALRADDLAQVEHLLLHLHDLVERAVRGFLEDVLLEFRDLERQFLEGGFVVFDHRIEQRVRDAVGRARHEAAALHAAVLDVVDTFEMYVVVGDQEILPEKKIQLTRREHAVAPAVIHGVDHHENVRRELVLVFRGVLLNLR